METMENFQNGPIKSKFGTRPNSRTGNSKIKVPRPKNEILNPRRQTNTKNKKCPNQAQIWYGQGF